VTGPATVIGVDVGGPAKGFHAVALSGQRVVGQTASRNPEGISDWCREKGAVVVAVDAPSRAKAIAEAKAKAQAAKPAKI
jgi:hypothetical protein